MYFVPLAAGRRRTSLAATAEPGAQADLERGSLAICWKGGGGGGGGEKCCESEREKRKKGRNEKKKGKKNCRRRFCRRRFLSFSLPLHTFHPYLIVAPSGLDERLRPRGGRREPHGARIRRLELAPSRVVGGVFCQRPHESAGGGGGVFSVAFLLRRRGPRAHRKGPVQGSEGGRLGGCRVCRVGGGGLDLVRLRELGGDLRVGVELGVDGRGRENDGGDEEQCRRKCDQHRELGCVSAHVFRFRCQCSWRVLMIERRSNSDRRRGMETSRGASENKKNSRRRRRG